MQVHTTAAVAAAAAAEAARRMRQEEEELTHYSREDLSDDWEFKIVRSATGAFRKPEEFANLLEEEARFGWVLLEKLDDGRVRFKRRAGGRSRLPPGEHQGDPYRSVYGMSPGRQGAIVALVMLGLAVIVGGMMLLLLR
jgi:hypothetical protein